MAHSPVLIVGCGHQQETLPTGTESSTSTAVSSDGAVPSQASSWDRVVELKQVFQLYTTSTMKRVLPSPVMGQVMKERRYSLRVGDIPNSQFGKLHPCCLIVPFPFLH